MSTLLYSIPNPTSHKHLILYGDNFDICKTGNLTRGITLCPKFSTSALQEETIEVSSNFFVLLIF